MYYTREQVENLPKLKLELLNTRESISKLEKQKKHFEKIIYDLERITEFYNGIPLDVIGERGTVVTIHSAPPSERGSKLFGSASHPQENTYIVFLYNRGEWAQQRGSLQYEEALKIAKEWVANGVMIDER
jgi:hypothetical protein